MIVKVFKEKAYVRAGPMKGFGEMKKP